MWKSGGSVSMTGLISRIWTSLIQKDFRDYVEDGGTTIAVCGGYQLLGHYYNTPEGKMEGLHLADLYTEQGSPRLISNIVLKNDRYLYPVVGFENHGGRTHLGEGVEPFGKVVIGYGNNGKDHEEGVIYRNVIGTYLHGPLLPKNPHVCDDLLLRALRRRGYKGTLQPLDDHEEREANAYIVKRFVGSSDS